eukprot:SAG22_NODE_1868_length_3404_cov_67.845688_5_plen_30_part_00
MILCLAAGAYCEVAGSPAVARSEPVSDPG